MNLIIRNEEVQDYPKTEEVCRNAFWNLYKLGAEEHYVLHKMRNHPDFIPELSFVLEKDGEVVGGIFFTHSHILRKNGEKVPTITFGPVFISPEYHRQSLGRTLINHAIQQAKNLGYLGILTLGYPYHYTPYGFLGGKTYGISMEDGKFYKGLLALPLQEGAFDDVSGIATFSEVFSVSQEEVNLFDQKFPKKEKKEQASQQEYQIACMELDESK